MRARCGCVAASIATLPRRRHCAVHRCCVTSRPRAPFRAPRALPRHPSSTQIVYRNYVDISVAVSSPRGLVVPVIRNAEGLTMAGLELAMADLAKRARADAIALEEMAGGTFTVSNGGVFGSMMGTPIINPPQSAILGMHGIKQRPVAINVRRGDGGWWWEAWWRAWCSRLR